MASKALFPGQIIAAASTRPFALGAARIDAILMLAAALTLRCWWFGNPVVQVDEQFYLLVGDRMLHGALPFVDIWDRKPIGLFLIYAAIRLLGGDGIIQYQLAATACAAATAWLVVRIARHLTGATAARLAGALALLWMLVFDGAGGQAPIIYGPLVAGAALITLRLMVPDAVPHPVLRASGIGAMALIGLAIQIKYTALFEGMAFGLLLLWTARENGVARPALIASGAMWVAAALAPTLIAFAVYAGWGHAWPFIYANFLSIGDRPPTGWLTIAKRIAVVALYSAPLIVAAWFGLRRREISTERERARRFMLCWLAGALLGFLAIGTFYKHYYLPMITPLAIAAAPAIGALRRRSALLPAIIVVPGLILAATTGLHRLRVRGDGHELAALLGALPAVGGQRIFVFAGDPILYYLTNSPLPTRFAFPGHLSEAREGPAIGADALTELRRVFAKRPGIVFSADQPERGANLAAWAEMRKALARDYQPLASVRIASRVRTAYIRSDLARP